MAGEAETWTWWWLLALPVAPVSVAMDIAVLALALAALYGALAAWLTVGGPAWAASSGADGRRNGTMRGPRGLPLVGSITAMAGLAHRKLALLARATGADDIMAFSMGRTPAVVCAEPAAARELLSSAAFADRPLKTAARLLMFDRAMGFAPYGSHWRHLRRLATTHLFSPRRLADAEPLRRHLADDLVRRFAVADAETDRVRVRSGVEAVRPRDALQRAALENILGCVFGRTLASPFASADVADMVREGYDLLGAFNVADHLPLPWFVDPNGVRRRCRALMPRVNAFVTRVIEQHRSSPVVADAGEADFTDVLLGLHGADRLAHSDMVAVLWEMVFRGTDTVAILLEWILARIVLHQDIQAKIHDELDAVVGKSRTVAESDIPKLHYMQAVVKEVLRMHPPGPLLSWARLAITDVHIAGHFIPAGTTAMVNMWAITHDEKFWNDPETFDPQRFMPGGEAFEMNVMGSDLRLAPFGSGRRVCPGKALGLHTVHVWLAKMLHHFKWLPCQQNPVDFSELLKLSCEMKHPLYAQPVNRISLAVQ